MTSEIVEPEIERIKISLAEENLIEQIRNYIVKLLWIVQESQHIANHLFNQKFEATRTRASKVVEEFKTVRDIRYNLARYVAKVAVSMIGTNYYVSLLDSITVLSNSLYKFILELELLGLRQIAIDESTILSIQNIIKSIVDYLTCLSDILRYFIESPVKGVQQISKIFRDGDTIIEMYRGIYLSQPYDLKHSSIQITTFILSLGNIIQDLVNLGEKIVWLYTIRTT
ncbi:MAG: hypothetical protein QW101_03330 [Ignisphaera sp.]|uniref:DUF47 family protein n=1 Tax=Ignisphaera aggregans TaxID=334771 RepID=A0A7J3MWK1_9CREN